MENKEQVVKAPVTEEKKPVEVVPGETPLAAPQAGDKTPPNLLLKSLQEERAKAARLEAELNSFKSQPPASEEIFSDEGKTLQGYIGKLKSEVSTLTSEMAKRDLLAANPILKDKWSDFEAFHTDPENAGMSLKTAAKAFIVEHGLNEEPKPRKGLEKPTGGTRSAPASGMTSDDVRILRQTNFRKYTEMLRKGQIVISE